MLTDGPVVEAELHMDPLRQNTAACKTTSFNESQISFSNLLLMSPMETKRQQSALKCEIRMVAQLLGKHLIYPPQYGETISVPQSFSTKGCER